MIEDDVRRESRNIRHVCVSVDSLALGWQLHVIENKYSQTRGIHMQRLTKAATHCLDECECKVI